VDDLQLRLQGAETELQQSTAAVAAAEEKRKADMQLLQQRLDAALESASQTSSAESAEVIADRRARLERAQAAANAQVEAFAAKADGLQQQVSCLIVHHKCTHDLNNSLILFILQVLDHQL